MNWFGKSIAPAMIALTIGASAVGEKALSWFAERAGAKIWQAPAAKAIRTQASREVLTLFPGYLDAIKKVGEDATARFVQTQGYTSLVSASKHGFDGLYVKTNLLGGLKEVLIVEVKTKNRALRFPPFPPGNNPSQMSAQWIRSNLAKIDQKKLNPRERRLLSEIITAVEQGSPRVRTEVWHHDIRNYKTLRYELTSRSSDRVFLGRSLATTSEDTVLKSVVEEGCASGALTCVPI
jgi:hypothetical protein